MGYELDFSAITASMGLLLEGAGLTLALTAIAATLGMALSIGGAATRRWGPVWTQRVVGAYVELIRNTPFIVQLFFLLRPTQPWHQADCSDGGGACDDHQPDGLRH